MSTSTEEEEFQPLPSRIRLNPNAAPKTETTSATKRLPAEAAKPKISAQKPTQSIDSDLPKPLMDDSPDSNEAELHKSSQKVGDNAKPESEEGPFGGSTKYFLIFLAVIFGTLLLVWIIGGQDEVSVDHLDQQYNILGLDPSANDDQVKSAFKKLAMKFHPDKCRLPDCAKQFIDVEKARDTILKWGAYFRARRVVQPQRSM